MPRTQAHCELPPDDDGQPVSILDSIPGSIPSPAQQLLQPEKQHALARFVSGFARTLRHRPDLRQLFRKLCAGQKRRHLAQHLPSAPNPIRRANALRAQLRRRLISFRAANPSITSSS